jgi:hypothetical protein
MKIEIDVTNFDTLIHRKFSNSIDLLKTAEGTDRAPTCFYVRDVEKRACSHTDT